jgi:hypothetical protein
MTPSSPEYEILKNGLIVRRVKNGKYERVVEIFAEMRDAQLLLAHAHKICPAAAGGYNKSYVLGARRVESIYRSSLQRL